MNFADWYTDRLDVWRVVSVSDGNLTHHERKQILSDIPCRIYRSDNQPVNMDQTAAYLRQADSLMCEPDVDILAGDECWIHLGGGLGKQGAAIRAFAAEPNVYYEPFGAVLPGLAHQEIRLLQQERVKGDMPDEFETTDGGSQGD